MILRALAVLMGLAAAYLAGFWFGSNTWPDWRYDDPTQEAAA